jgi:hypothetical protein
MGYTAGKLGKGAFSSTITSCTAHWKLAGVGLLVLIIIGIIAASSGKQESAAVNFVPVAQVPVTVQPQATPASSNNNAWSTVKDFYGRNQKVIEGGAIGTVFYILEHKFGDDAPPPETNNSSSNDSSDGQNQ